MEEKTILYIILVLVSILVVYLMARDFFIPQGAYIFNETTGEIVGGVTTMKQCFCQQWKYGTVKYCTRWSC